MSDNWRHQITIASDAFLECLYILEKEGFIVPVNANNSLHSRVIAALQIMVDSRCRMGKRITKLETENDRLMQKNNKLLVESDQPAVADLRGRIAELEAKSIQEMVTHQQELRACAESGLKRVAELKAALTTVKNIAFDMDEGSATTRDWENLYDYVRAKLKEVGEG